MLKNIVILLFTSFIFAQNTSSKTTYIGTINNNINVIFELKNKKGVLSGFYFYEKKGINITLIGTLKNQEVELFELDYANHKTAKISGTFKNTIFTGKWENLVSKKSLPLTFKQTNQEITPLPHEIIGNYSLKNEENTVQCNLLISVSFLKGDYFYHITGTKINQKGKIRFYRSLMEKTNYIIFEGLLPSEGGGTYIEGLLDDNQITIQNTGNVMNYYVKFAICDKKYLEFIK